MGKPTVSPTAKAPQAPQSLPLTAVTIRRLTDFDRGNSSTSKEPGERPEHVALAMDFVARLHYRRNADDQAEWAAGARLVESVYGLAYFINEQRELDVDMRTFLADSLEYLAIRIAIALDGPERRMARWRVSVADVDAAKAVAS
jgi:hypothetical protein